MSTLLIINIEFFIEKADPLVDFHINFNAKLIFSYDFTKILAKKLNYFILCRTDS